MWLCCLLTSSQEGDAGHQTVDLQDDDADSVYHMIAYIYGKRYRSRSPVQSKAHSDAALLPHVHLYITADKYSIQALKAYALKDIDSVLGNVDLGECEPDLYDAMRLFFTQTPDTCKDRTFVARSLAQHIPHLKRTVPFRQLVLEVPEFGLAMIDVGYREPMLATAEDAYEWLGQDIGPDSDDNFVTTACAIRVADDREVVGTARKAVELIMRERGSGWLLDWLQMCAVCGNLELCRKCQPVDGRW